MSDPSQSDAWPPRWDPPPPAATPTPREPFSPAAPDMSNVSTPAGLPEQPTLAAPSGWPTYNMPPDLPQVASTQAHDAAPTPLPHPASKRRAAPWPLLGAAAVAAAVGIAGTLVFVHPSASATDRGGDTVTTYAAPPSPDPEYPASSYSAPPPPTSTDVTLAAEDPDAALRQQAVKDQALIAQVPEGYWVPQLSSKRDGLVADGIVYSSQTIWADHVAVRSVNPGAALLWSGDYTTFKYPDFWVTIVPSAYSSTPEGANSWCDAQGFDADHCFAKRISTTTTYTTTTKNR